MGTTDNHTTWDTLRSTTATAISSPLPKLQNYIGVWLDSNCHQDANAPIKRALRDIFNSLELFTDFDKCTTYINQPRPAKIFFIVSHDIGKNLIPLMLSRPSLPVEYIYIYCTELEEKEYWHSNITDKIQGGYTTVESLTQQIKNDISAFDERMTVTISTITAMTLDNDSINPPIFYAVPSTLVLDKNIKNTAIKDLSKDYVWFIQFQLLVEILIRLDNPEQAKRDVIFICKKYYEDNPCEQNKIQRFEQEADNLSRIIYWYTAESFLIHLLNRVCGTEDVDHLYYFRLIISNLHKRICQLESDTLTINLKRTETETILYRGKRISASTLENFRKNVGSIVAMKGFLSTTMDGNVAEIFAGGGIEQNGSVCVLFQLRIVKWEECKTTAAIIAEDSVMKDESEVLFSIGSIWKIDKVDALSVNGIWRVELTSCPESNACSTELTSYLKKELGDTSDLWTLGDFLMKLGEYKKAEKYYDILEKNLNLPEQHVDRARIYNRKGIIRREQNELKLAIDYFKKAVEAAPPDSGIGEAANANVHIAQRESNQARGVFLGRSVASSDVISKPLVANESSKPIVENNLGYVAYLESNYDEAVQHYNTALSSMMKSKLTFLHEISCVYNNLGAVEYDKKKYGEAKNYFEKAIFTLQEFSSNHQWITEYKQNLACAQKKLPKRQRIE